MPNIFNMQKDFLINNLKNKNQVLINSKGEVIEVEELEELLKDKEVCVKLHD